MFGLGLPEIIVIFVIALLIFGPKKLPDMGKSIGRAIAEFKKASDDFQETVKAEMKEVEKSSGVDELKKIGDLDLSDAAADTPAAEQAEGAKTDEKKDGQQQRGKAGRHA